MMAVNVELLRKVRKLIAEEPKRMNMHVWGRKTKAKNGPACGRVACLAGWTILASKSNSEWKRLFKANNAKAGSELSFARNVGPSVDSEAAKLLGIPQNECPFWQTSWKAKNVLAWIDEQIAKAGG